jgi:hypothetical protein
MRLRRYLLLLLICGLVGAASRAAHAQQATMSDLRGIRLGDALVLHLSLGTEFQYDSNVFYTASNQTGAFTLRLYPQFDLTNRPRGGDRRQIEFDFHGGFNYLEYLTSDTSVSSHRQFGVDAGLVAAFFTMSPYNFAIFDNYVRTTQPPYTQTSHNLDRDTNELGLRVNLAPGGGRLTFNIGYRFGIDFFEPQELKEFDLFYHVFDVRASWKFFPKTAVYIAASEGIYQYQHPGTPPHPNSYPFHIIAGMQGLITVKLTVNAWVGYANGFYVSGPSPNTAVGGLSLTWKPTLLSAGTIGYQHDFQNSLLGAFYDVDQAYVSWSQQIWRFNGFLRFSYANQRYQGIFIPAGGTSGPQAETNVNRVDNYITLNVRADYKLKDWLFASVGYDLQANVSNGQLDLGVAGLVPVDYTKHVVYLRLSLVY